MLNVPEDPSVPKIRTVPLPFVNESNFPDGSDHYPSARLKNTSNHEAKVFTSSAVAKPKHIEYEDQSEISDFFYPTAEDRALEIWS